ncbi:hypothetical protein [Candidatus Paracaedibacter symbiosus]|uniref:hypothetical protein n=1 Tax=Candidatus Paracaedibacter symbiosus TaxID=244582 RepID=UPI00050960BC|nr:hypothetical protein [Candidatus Paracaedibacter symbiosus]
MTIIKVGLFLLSLTTAIVTPSSADTPLADLDPLLEALSKPAPAPDTAQNFEKFLAKAADIAIATIQKSNPSISSEKIAELRRNIHDAVETMGDDLYLPLDVD